MTRPVHEILGVSADTGWPETRCLPAPGNPMAVARELLETAKMGETLCWWRGDFYRWTETRWETWDDADVRNWLYRQTENALYLVPGKDGAMKEMAWAPTTKKISDLFNALGNGAVQRDSELEPDDGTDLVAFTNGERNGPRCVHQRRARHAHHGTPRP